MVVLHTLSDFIDCNHAVSNSSPSYYYQGHCPQTGELLKLPRTPLVEAIAYHLMQQLASDELYSREGKMYGILLVELPSGEQRILKAFSGLLNGCSVLEGWVPPIPGRDEVALDEARTLAELDAIKQELITLKQLPERQQYATLSREFELGLQQISDRHQDRKRQRHTQRQVLSETLTAEALTTALEQLEEESRRDGIERRQLKRRRDEVLQPFKQIIDNADIRMQELRQRRKELSRQLQAQMHAAYSLMNFFGQSRSLQQLMPEGLPTGTGECCAPKLLHYAATHNLKPLAIAEFWWGPSSNNQDKIPGEFYGACVERCQPLMGFLLSGLEPNPPDSFPRREGGVRSLTPYSRGVWGEVPILYEDEWLIVVNKPPGLLSVPGRYRDTQDSVLSRLRHLLPDGMALTAVHRLDQQTSGILLLARDRQTYSQLSQQFQQQQVCKIYEAVLSGTVTINQGVIDLPLWGDPQNRPYQKVNWQYGKPSLTKFQIIGKQENYTRIEFIPLTGRTHQLRVHAADPQGLGVAILGDRLYGCCAGASRLHLHARELSFEHPQLGERLHLHTQTPF
ncbi:RluA family pseudouridine synthase [Fischerella sp. JS2]|uniref:RluA family pseudouridine synthase n=1 Tax=Fischerella sp. JS2 TaxID=2597771 RepID=UPI0028E25C1C|nr:pseudouridine synthase [Fischerella sp. JS2]